MGASPNPAVCCHLHGIKCGRRPARNWSGSAGNGLSRTESWCSRACASGNWPQSGVCDLALDAPPPTLRLDARHVKNREGPTIVLRADLAADLREWVA